YMLGQKCSNEKSYRNNRLAQARFKNAEGRRTAEALKMPSCEEYQERFPTSSRYRS
ncbi:hypothetical protein B484DRAFT_397625, partial [Ochromonadaceae sp. CCMP2298]